MAYALDGALENPWEVGTAVFPTGGTAREKLLFALNYAVLAPSILNTQPWRFRVTNHHAALHVDMSRRLPVVDPAGRELMISCGAALLNLRTALRGFGYEPAIKLFPTPNEPDCLAEIHLGTPIAATQSQQRLRDAIPARRTSRMPFEKRPVPGAQLEEIARAAEQEGGTLSFIEDADRKQQVGALVAEAVRIHLADPAFRRELSDWVNKRVDEAYERSAMEFQRLTPGQPMAGRTPPPVDERALSIPSAAGTARRFADADRAAADRQARTEGAPVLALLTTPRDTRADWLMAGQALGHALLVATVAGVAASYDSSPLEIPELRSRVAGTFGVGGLPQVLLRLGYAAETPPSARQPLRTFVMEPPSGQRL